MTTDPLDDRLPCNFCGKEPLQIKIMMAGKPGSDALICDECLFTGMIFLAHTEDIDFDALVSEARRRAPDEIEEDDR